jgi:hypothetical protein
MVGRDLAESLPRALIEILEHLLGARVARRMLTRGFIYFYLYF